MNEAIRQVTHVQNIRYDKAEERLYIIDQTLLPNEEKEIELRTVEEMIEAIKMLRIRGAPAIGICAGYCMYALARDIDAKDNEAFYRKLQIDGELLGVARPTAVNLRWAVGEMLDTAKAHLKDDRAELLEALYRKAVDIHEDDIAKCTAISEYGLSLLKDGDGVLTHCNAGPLATSRYGTGQGPFLLAAERGIHIRVFADETRPLLQGARLTSYELQRAGVDVTLICDNMASMVMKNGWVQACFVGCDRIAANGDFANKIGTSGVAILAKHYGIPVYTLGPTSTIDMNCPDGAHIPIELRDGDEIKNLWYEKPMALPEVKCFNPSFDVTDHELLTGIVTEKGICYPPFNESLAALFKDKK
ncbi:S-methyl-5-thioribose-1-phosphate isomerase [Dysosmobacter sp.]|uniref:S-methyl-5-thioribose-1-phosphate isomerase n=1 Tax=Dysosmobacter sp. TaxID=2591382 RepID=UPI003AB3C383